MTNAVDALEGVGSVRVRTYTNHDERVTLVVQDTGCGIDMGNIPKMFEPFFPTKPVEKGIGIGLSTCYAIVQEHEGRYQCSKCPR